MRCDFMLERRSAPLGFVPGVVNAMDHGEIGANRKDQQSNRKGVGQPIQKRTDNQQAEAFGTFPKTDAAAINERFSAGLSVADHDRTGHCEACEQRIQEAIDRRIVDKEAHENGEVSVAMQNRFQKCTEEIRAGLKTRKWPSEKITNGGGNHGESRGEKAASAEENAGENAESKTTEGEETCRNACPGETSDRTLKHPAKRPSKELNAHIHN